MENDMFCSLAFVYNTSSPDYLFDFVRDPARFPFWGHLMPSWILGVVYGGKLITTPTKQNIVMQTATSKGAFGILC